MKTYKEFILQIAEASKAKEEKLPKEESSNEEEVNEDLGDGVARMSSTFQPKTKDAIARKRTGMPANAKNSEDENEDQLSAKNDNIRRIRSAGSRMEAVVNHNEKEKELKGDYDRSPGSPFDQGEADFYYGRGPEPHFYKGGKRTGQKVMKNNMSAEEIKAYQAGYAYGEYMGDKKDPR